MMKLMKNSILPLAALFLIGLLGQYLYIVDGQIDWFRLCMVFGVPFGIPYMLFVIPIGGSISRGVGILALNAIVGALFGSVIAVFAFVKAVVYLIWYLISSLARAVKRN
jgi:hypothetical protein